MKLEKILRLQNAEERLWRYIYCRSHYPNSSEEKKHIDKVASKAAYLSGQSHFWLEKIIMETEGSI